MKEQLFVMIAVFLILAGISCQDQAEKIITIATTTSTENSGLLAYLHPVFEKEKGIKVKVIALGTGAAIECAEQGNADLILVHAREKEDKFVTDGYGVNRKDVMHNDFVMLGPVGDPAGIRGMKDVSEALKKIARNKAVFVSRGDDSGTHIKEQDLWEETGIPVKEAEQELAKSGIKKKITLVKPEGDWYFSIGQGMGNTINFTFEKQGYTLADRGTYLAYKDKVDLIVLVEGDKRLFNPYGIIAVNPEKHPSVNYKHAMTYINWITSPKIQTLIGDYKINGEVLFSPDAVEN